MKNIRKFPFISVRIATDDFDTLKQDMDLKKWIDNVNTVKMEMAAAHLDYIRGSLPTVMIRASSRRICRKYCDELRALLAEKGFQTQLYSLLYADEAAVEYSGSDVVISDSVTWVNDRAFSKNSAIKSVVIPDSVNRIGKYAFSSCSSLEGITIPDSVTEIEDYAFLRCRGLKTVTLSNKLEKLSWGVFCYCVSLKNIIIPESVSEIQTDAFTGCDSLNTIILPPKVKKIDSFAFSCCKNLINVVIPESVSEFGIDVFGKCSPALTIRGKKGSAAERYAAENGIGFAAID